MSEQIEVRVSGKSKGIEKFIKILDELDFTGVIQILSKTEEKKDLQIWAREVFQQCLTIEVIQ